MRQQVWRPDVRVAIVVLVALTLTAGYTTREPTTAAKVEAATPVGSPPATPGATPASSATPIAWIELGPGGARLARAITTDAGCPTLTEDGVSQPMQVHAVPDAETFPVTVCEAVVSSSATAAVVAGQPLPLPSGTPRRIAVIGDTGCRMKDPSYFQACNDPRQWPFQTIAAQVAAWQPDLIIHVGDYHYRESACPTGNVGCTGSPTGDTWASWNADFFAPTGRLLTAAPWIFIRGNHETCARAGDGWFRLLDPRPVPSACQTYTDPYAVPIGDLQLLVLDSSSAADAAGPADQTAEYRQQFATLAQLAGTHAWLVSHKPIWGIYQTEATGTGGEIEPDSAGLEAAVGAGLPTGVQLLLAGHLHRFEVVSFEAGSGRPPQFVSGNAGTALDPPVVASPTGLQLAGATVADGTVTSQFGYLTLEPAGDGWTATAHTATGAIIVTCDVHGTAATCTP